MVAPDTGGNNEVVSTTLKLNTAEAKKALEDIMASEANVATKTEQLKNLIMGLARGMNTSFETAAAGLKKFDAAFTGTTNSIISNALKIAQAQASLSTGPISTATAIPNVQEETGVAVEASKIRADAIATEEGQEADRHNQAMTDAELEKQQALELAAVRENAALQAQIANEKITASIIGIVQAETSVEVKAQQLGALMTQVAVQTGVPLEVVASQFRAMEGAFAGTSTGLVTLALNSAKAQQGFDGLGKSAGGMGNIMGRLEFSFIRFTALFTVIGLIRDFIMYLGQATQAALDFNQALFGFEAGVRALQRSGLDATIKQFSDDVDALQAKFPIFAKKDILEGYNQILLLTRGLGLTKDQISQIAQVSATASVLLGKNFADAAQEISKSLASGYFQTAQNAGYLVSRQRVVEEAMRMGIETAKKGYDAMTDQQRAIATLSVYMQQNASIQEDATKIVDNQAGKVKEASAAWADFTRMLGQVFSPLKALGAESTLGIIDSIGKLAERFKETVTLLVALKTLVDAFTQKLVDAGKQSKVLSPILDFFERIGRAINFAGDFLAAFIAKIITLTANLAGLGDIWNKAITDARRFTGLDTLMGDIGFKAGSKLGQGIQDGIDASLSAPDFIKLGQDIYDELTSLTNRIQQLWLDYTRKIHDIVAQANLDIANANAKYNQDVINANIDADQRRADAERQYRINEINAEAQFQEKMRQLREKFLFDLEDALRNRDARQVLRLVRQYQMDKTDAAKQEQLAYNERKRAYEEELRQIEQQRANKLRLLAEEHAAEIAQIRQNEALKIQEALTYYEREKADAEQAAADRIAQQTLDFQRQYNLTDAQAKSLVNLLNGYFGVNGPVAATYRNLVSYIMALVSIARTGLAALAGFGTQIPNTIPGAGTPTPPATHAKGGTFFARKPTLAIYGDAGPEYATFTPANKLSQNQSSSGQTTFSTNPSAGVSGMLKLLVTLSPDLRLEIKNDTLHEVSSTIEEINRKRR